MIDLCRLHLLIAGMIVIGAAPPVSPPPISRQAFIATMDGEYARLDINNDGVVTQTELEQNQRGLVIQAATRRALQEFAALDADHNGQVSQAEWLKARVAANPAVNAATVMKRLDRNGDGKVSLVEYRALTLANFDRLDTDLDGFVSAAEQRAGAKPR